MKTLLALILSLSALTSFAKTILFSNNSQTAIVLEASYKTEYGVEDIRTPIYPGSTYRIVAPGEIAFELTDMSARKLCQDIVSTEERLRIIYEANGSCTLVSW